MKKIILVGLIFFATSCFAVPREIVMVRHADKWAQDKTGPYLSPKGQIRAAKLVGYYLSHYPKPDYIFASKPNRVGPLHEAISFRPFQTVAPLANELTVMSGRSVRVHMPYHPNEYHALASALLHQKQYDHKMILISWEHEKIDEFAKALGVKRALPKWDANNYDQVYVLKYDVHGKLSSFKLLQHQYPVSGNPTWAELAGNRC